MNETTKITWAGPRADLYALSDALSETLWPPADAVSLTKRNAAQNDDETEWLLEAYFQTPPTGDALSPLIIDGVTEIARETLEDRDWVAEALEGLGVVRCGRFILYGVHDADKLPNEDGDIPIRIDANQAFGTGHHPTTAGCLTLLDRFAGMAPKKVLDLGCGSAVLAIAAAKLWRRMALATDIDPTSIEIAEENIALNEAEDFVVTCVSDGFDHPDINDAAPFDFIFANILAGPLKELAPGMASHCAKNGRVMLAGLMAEQEADVVAAYEKAGFRILNRLDDPIWPVLLFVRT